jgi:outer membrane protein
LNGKKEGRSNATPTNHTYRFMKKFLLLALGLTLALPLAAFAQGGLKVGTVDMNRAFKEYSKTKDAESKINSARDAAKKEFDDRADAYKKALEEVNNLNKQLDAPALSADAKTQKAKERDDKINNIKNMEREINEFRQTRERQLQEQALRMREGIVKEITDIVMDRVKTQNMDLVFDKSGMSLNGVPLVMYARENYDFTNDVVAALNKPGRTSSVSTDAKASDTTSTSPATTRTAPSTVGTATRPSPATTATPRKP